MKKANCFAVMALGGLTACGSAVSLHKSSAAQLIDVDAQTRLRVRVEGGDAHPSGALLGAVAKPSPGAPIHRVLEGSDGKVLFAYDLEVGKGAADGLYHFVLKPSSKKPTFEGLREVAVRPRGDSVRVELMERPETGEKVVDVFELGGREDVTVKERKNLHAQIHSFMMHLFEGK
jgi:hypothetical protein